MYALSPSPMVHAPLSIVHAGGTVSFDVAFLVGFAMVPVSHRQLRQEQLLLQHMFLQ